MSRSSFIIFQIHCASAGLRHSNHVDDQSRVRFLRIADARIALVSAGGGGIDSISAQVIELPLPGKTDGEVGDAVVIDTQCLTIDLAPAKDFMPIVKTQWKHLDDAIVEGLVCVQVNTDLMLHNAKKKWMCRICTLYSYCILYMHR